MLLSGKRGFTLVELLVVMAILGILAAALTTQVTKARAIGQSMRCKANMRNLAQAAINFGIDRGHVPTAGSFEYAEIFSADTGQLRYDLNHDNKESAWVAWTGSGSWPNTTPQAGGMSASKFYADQSENASQSLAYDSITKGSLWSYVGKDLSTYCCDVFRTYARRDKSLKALRSYVMNGYFGYADAGNGLCSRHSDSANREAATLSARGSAGNLLMFAELPARKIDVSERGADSVLETKIRDYTANNSIEEMIGFNHEISGSRGGDGGGKRYAAHVAFADGHVDVLIEPRGASDGDIKELTRLLCNGDEITRELRSKMK